MKLSFVVPIYNVEKYIAECIESILKQTLHDFEIVLVNDGSKDNSGKICDEYAEKYSNISVIHQPNQGVSVARNTGIDACSGEWIFFIDGDDTISARLFEEANEFLNPAFDVCFVRHLEVKDGTHVQEQAVRNKIIFEKENFKEFELAIFNRDLKGKYDYHEVKMATPCKFYRKNMLIENSIKFPKGVATGEDALFNLQVYLHAQKGAFIDGGLYFHRIWGDSVSKRYDPNAEKKFAILHRNLQEYIEKSSNPELFKAAFQERCLWSLGFCCILNYCSVSNPLSYKKRKREFQKDREKYLSLIKEVNLRHFRLEKRIMFLCIRHNWFFLINILCLLKNKG